MSRRARQIGTWLALTIGATSLATCGPSRRADHSAFEEPFDFAEVRSLSLPIKTMTTANEADTLARLGRNRGRIAAVYRTALSRFQNIYGDGVGPAKNAPDYLNCRAAFSKVETLINNEPAHGSDDRFTHLRTSLQHCRDVAKAWSGPAEMATFGNDLLAMSDGSLLVLGYAATIAEPALGQQIYQETIALPPPARSLD